MLYEGIWKSYQKKNKTKKHRVGEKKENKKEFTIISGRFKNYVNVLRDKQYTNI